MKLGIRTPSLKKSFSSRTRGKIKKKIKKTVNPLYGKKGMGYLKNPPKAVYNSVYRKTTVGFSDLKFKRGRDSSCSKCNSENTAAFSLKVTSSNFENLVKDYPQLTLTLDRYYRNRRNWALVMMFLGLFSLLVSLIVSVIFLIISFCLLLSAREYKKKYNNALYYERKAEAVDSQRMISNIQANRNFTKNVRTVSRSREPFIKHYGGPDNMNCELYMFSAKCLKTGRMHNNHILEVYNFDDVKHTICNEGYGEPIEFSKIDFPRPSEAQIAYLRDKGLLSQPTQLSCEDATAILSMYEDKDKASSKSFMQFASDMHIRMSYYMGTERGYNTIFNLLGEKDRIAFFTFCVYRLVNEIQNENMNESTYKSLFYEFAEEVCKDDGFLKSFAKIDGSRLRRIGNENYNGEIKAGLNRNAIAFKKAFEFLKRKGIAK